MIRRRQRLSDFELAAHCIEAAIARRWPELSGHWATLAPLRPPRGGLGLERDEWLAEARRIESAFNRLVRPPTVRFSDSELLELGTKPLVLFQLRLAAARERSLAERHVVRRGRS
jgi:extradiol dioxygenase family protein